MKDLIKIDKFYLVLGLVLLIMAVVSIFTLRTIFASLEVAGEINEEVFQASTPRINKANLEKAMNILDNGSFIPLDVD